ncbi:MAG: Wzz/FepE/Etk N-terminal domain-containing protein [Clostridiales bacterium]|nr:Wzz/FepE/Etk N-terminal domain-containing protein [Clostridiales bacterium]
MERKTGKGSHENDVIEIDLLQLLLELKRRLLLIITVALLCGGIAMAYSMYVLIPQYQSTVMMYVLSKETTLTSLADLQIGTQLTADYQIIVTSRPVLEDVIDELNLNINYHQLKNQIFIDNPTGTRILSITVQDTDPIMAKRIADCTAETAADYIGDIMELVPPKMIESGEIPLSKSSPNNMRNAMIGAFAGAFVVCAWVTMEMVLNDTIRGEEDVERYLGLTVLASVPERIEGSRGEDTAARKKSSRWGRKKRRKA